VQAASDRMIGLSLEEKVMIKRAMAREFMGYLCFSTKPAALRRKSKDWSTRNQDNVSEWGDMLIRGLL
jgi:hypothetical protein